MDEGCCSSHFLQDSSQGKVPPTVDLPSYFNENNQDDPLQKCLEALSKVILDCVMSPRNTNCNTNHHSLDSLDSWDGLWRTCLLRVIFMKVNGVWGQQWQEQQQVELETEDRMSVKLGEILTRTQGTSGPRHSHGGPWALLTAFSVPGCRQLGSCLRL